MAVTPGDMGWGLVWSGLFGGTVSPKTLSEGFSTDRRPTSHYPYVGPGSCSPELKYVPCTSAYSPPRSWPKSTASPEGCMTDRSTTSSRAPKPWPPPRRPGSRPVRAKPRLLPCATSISRGSACLVGRGSPESRGGCRRRGGWFAWVSQSPGLA